MSKTTKDKFANIFHQLEVLQASVTELANVESQEIESLSGQQTLDVEDAVHLSFTQLLDLIAELQVRLATIAEATGEISKFSAHSHR